MAMIKRFWKRTVIFFVVYLPMICFLSAQDKASLVNWQLMYNDTVVGTDATHALEWLKKHRKPSRQPIIVGVIDSGTDTTHTYLKPSFWVNIKEIPDGKDNDGNGYIDDIHGWNFLGAKNDTFNVVEAGSQEFREFRRLYPKYKNYPTDSASLANASAEYEYYLKMMEDSQSDVFFKILEHATGVLPSYVYIDSVARVEYPDSKSLTVGDVLKLKVSGNYFSEAMKTVSGDIAEMQYSGNWNDLMKQMNSSLKEAQEFKKNLDSGTDLRHQVGDDINNSEDRFYGNTDLMVGPFDHGAFVGGVIAAQENEGNGMVGVYPEARIMAIRAIPRGDEYDKDVASAIYYAVDNGAKVVNMSFGKMISPHKEMVDEALRYAADHDVLLIQASGNNGIDRDEILFYPYGTDINGARLGNMLCVGASDVEGNPCIFSNYGKKTVDVFAPGASIWSIAPDNSYVSSSGTSVASPVVAGIAAMIRHYFPKLTAVQVRDILMESVIKIDREVVSPGTGEMIRYNELCVSGGIVNAMKAVKLANGMSKKGR